LISTLNWSEWSVSCPCPFTTEEKFPGTQYIEPG
jgi:hypothetical protein